MAEIVYRGTLKTREEGLNPITVLLATVSLFVMMNIAVRFWESDSSWERSLARYALLLGLFSMTGLAFLFTTSRFRLFSPRDLRTYWTWALIWSSLLTIVVIVVEIALLQTLGRSAVDDTTKAMYYIFAGCCEELFFRLFLIGLASRFSRKATVRYSAVFVSALVFMMAHQNVYGDQSYLMLTQFILGLIWGFQYAVRRDILPNILSHMGKNLIAVRSLLVLR